MNLPYSFANKKLMTPGPVPLPKGVTEIFNNCHVHHRTEDFSLVLVEVLKSLKRVFQTSEHCYLLPATGTGAMEALVVNVLSPGDRVLVVDGGKFGERWRLLCETFGIHVESFVSPWGENLDLTLVEEKFSQNSYKALLMQACETSTGQAHPVEKMAQLCQKYNSLCIVDGITALAAYDLPMDKWGIDGLIGGSQKGFMLPTGMSFLSLSKKAQAAMTQSTFPKFYWNLNQEKKANEGGRTHFSTPTHFVLALHHVLNEILEVQGLASFYKNIKKRGDFFREKVNLELFPATPSPSLSCLRVPEGHSGVKIQKTLYLEDHIVVVAGQDQLKDKVIRVGHMGEMSLMDLEKTAHAINRIVGSQ